MRIDASCVHEKLMATLFMALANLYRLNETGLLCNVGHSHAIWMESPRMLSEKECTELGCLKFKCPEMMKYKCT